MDRDGSPTETRGEKWRGFGPVSIPSELGHRRRRLKEEIYFVYSYNGERHLNSTVKQAINDDNAYDCDAKEYIAGFRSELSKIRMNVRQFTYISNEIGILRSRGN